MLLAVVSWHLEIQPSIASHDERQKHSDLVSGDISLLLPYGTASVISNLFFS